MSSQINSSRRQPPRPLVKFLWRFNIFAITLLVLWLAIGNGLAGISEKPLVQAKTELLQQFPARPANASALKLSELAAPLGIQLPVGPDQVGAAQESSDNKVNLADRQIQKNRQQIQQEIRTYLEAQKLRSIDVPITPPPQILQRYLNAHAADLEAITTYLLSHELPFWSQNDLNRYLDPYYPLPSHLSLSSFSQVLMLDSLEKNRSGLFEAALDRLAAAWKLPQSLTNQPFLISQLVALIMANQLAGISRQINPSPSNWQQRFPPLELQRPFFKVLNLEHVIGVYRLIGLPNQGINKDPFNYLLGPFLKPYFVLSAADNWQRNSQVNQAIMQQVERDFCPLDLKLIQQRVGAASPWNLSADVGSFANQWFKVGKHQLNWELTQKIFQVKELGTKSGSFPQSIPGIEASKICQGNLWGYQVTANGQEATLSLRNKPAWLVQNEKDLPLTYTVKLQPKA